MCFFRICESSRPPHLPSSFTGSQGVSCSTSGAASLLLGRRRTAGGHGKSTADVVEVSDAVELDVDALDLPVSGDAGDAEHGDAAHGHALAEGGGPDERDGVAVVRLECHLDGEVVGLITQTHH